MSVNLSCEPCIHRQNYTIRAIVHGTSDDEFWKKLAASASQSAIDMRVNLNIQLYPPEGYSEKKMATDIRNAAASNNGDGRVDALVVTIPSLAVENAVRYAAQQGMPIFGLNSGYEAAGGVKGLVGDGSVLFFTAMNERLGGEKAAEYFLQKFAASASFGEENHQELDDEKSQGEAEACEISGSASGTTLFNNTSSSQFQFMVDCKQNITLIEFIESLQSEFLRNDHGNNNATTAIENTPAIKSVTQRTSNLYENYTNAVFITPLGEENTAYDQRFEGYQRQLIEASNNTNSLSIINVEWYKLDISSKESMERGLSDIFSKCPHQSVLVGSGKLAPEIDNALRSYGCHLVDTPTMLGTFDTSSAIFDAIAANTMEFAIDQHNHMQGWAPVHFAALYVSTGLVVSSPPGDGVYLSGPELFTQRGSSSITDSLRICTNDAFPICPNRKGPDGLPSKCPCTERKKIVIGGVTHGITTDVFWDTVYAAAEQGAKDMNIDLRFDRFEPQSSQKVLYRKMSAKILSLCQDGVDGLFVTISDPTLIDAVKRCKELDVEVLTINAGIAASKELGLLHHIGMVEENAGYLSGFKMADMATFTKAFCLNPFPDLPVLGERCTGFETAMGELGIEYLGQVDVPDDNIRLFRTIVEEAVGAGGSWEGYGMLLVAPAVVPALMELKKLHTDFQSASFDTTPAIYEALAHGDMLFGIDQQPYIQGYAPIPILTHAATTKQHFFNFAIESGPSFVTSPPSSDMVACQSGAFAVCPKQPFESYSYVNTALIGLGIFFFSLQAAAAVGFLGWMAKFRKTTVVNWSQPEFLSVVAIGCLTIASAILPLSIQGGYRYERDAITLEETDVLNEDIHKVDAACMAVPWLICTGFVLTYSALVAKLRRIDEIMRNAEHFIRVTVTKRKYLPIIAVLLSIMVALLLAWQLVSPLRWEREVIGTDVYTGYPTESIGRCTSEHFAAFAGSCAAFVGFCLIYALVLSYRTRHMAMEWSESKFIAASVSYLLQLLLLGVPILVIARENTNAYYMVLSLILFLMSFGTTLLIFAPKVILKEIRESQRRENVANVIGRQGDQRSSIGTTATNTLRKGSYDSSGQKDVKNESGGEQ
eukprot:CAMPEP_0183744890 /NCGR_PEP_ID=MMETSP0737-20130205/65954_1 /TAXON_ID=385413 /ORGANISM="Thalassiosira miniscula, Strain CCMP1093" /LENGTH=1105 /DNA_ID=CAMNT_0025980543 /DNA_START=60 /DNA_END=3377 /DNA_ORIENTATION=-